MNKVSTLILIFCTILAFGCDTGQEDKPANEPAVDSAQTETAETPEAESAKPQAEAQKSDNSLISFFKAKFGTRLPGNAEITMGDYKQSPVPGLDEGSFIVAVSGKGQSPIPFLASKDRRYMIIGASQPTDLSKFDDSEIEGMKKGTLNFGRQPLPVLVSDDGKMLIVGEVLDTTVDPLSEVFSKIELDNIPVKGSDDASITVVEYSDFQCPFCRRASDMLPGLLEEYDGKIKVVFKQFPLPNHNWAKPASIASLCAFEQGNDHFWTYHDLIFKNQRQITLENSKEKFNEFAKETGLDQAKFDSCLANEKIAARVDAELNEGRAVGVNSTPTFVVDGLIVPGADLNSIKNAINSRM